MAETHLRFLPAGLSELAGMHDEHELESVDLVFLRPYLREAERFHHGKRRSIGGRDAREDFILFLAESPTYEASHGLFRETLAPVSLKDRIADLRAPDYVRRTVKAAVPYDRLRFAEHQSSHPVAPVGRLLYSLQLNRKEAGEVVMGRKVRRNPQPEAPLGQRTVTVDQVPDGNGVEGNKLQAWGLNRGGHSPLYLSPFTRS